MAKIVSNHPSTSRWQLVHSPSAPGFDEGHRIENILTDENGEKVRLNPGADVDVIVEADTDATTKMPSA
jgi:hypothetical protein